ncbi:hypothetical protein KVT40_005805 [Elsinoe batatas]|uniref:Major facilitator superfamily (MFS) profile domain-containing protein n=1 Tax=Elsinoe batatas TaxID=2601811 RepID=A0A8K0L3P8_9PEZI|nr:hypothetical protein KVT40_005805 [Elsinoe batatas]
MEEMGHRHLGLGRRPVFLASIILLTVAGIWCTFSGSLTSHIAGRNIMSLAAGQSEALSPLMIHEIHFLHEPSKKLSWFIFVQNVSVGLFFIATQYLVASYGWRWWYGLFTIINGVVVVLAFFFAAETAFDRPFADMTGQSTEDGKHTKVTIASHRQAMTSISGSVWDGLSIIARRPQWRRIPSFYLGVLKGFCIAPVVWAFLLNGAWLGLYVFQAAAFAPILMKPPYLFSFTNLAFVQGSQIIVCLIFLPLLGYGGDFLAKYLAKRNNSMYKPEYRLLSLAFSLHCWYHHHDHLRKSCRCQGPVHMELGQRSSHLQCWLLRFPRREYRRYHLRG